MAAQGSSPKELKQESEAQEYDNLMEEVKDQLPEDLSILDRLKLLQGCKVVDLGCGTGNYTYRIAERVGTTGRVIGVDPNPERIEIASQKWVKENLTFMVGDGEHYPEDQYDLVFSHHALHWVEDKRPTFKKAYKNLRPGGQFAFVAGRGRSAIGDEMSALMGPAGHQAVKGLWHFMSPDEYREMAMSVGFKVVMMEEDSDIYEFASVNALLASWYGITVTLFNALKANQSELEAFKQKYTGEKPKLKFPVIRAIFSKIN